MRSDVVKKFIEIVDDHSTRGVVVLFVVPALEETMELLLLIEVPEIKEDILFKRWD